MKTSAAGEGCPRSAATGGRGLGKAARAIRRVSAGFVHPNRLCPWRSSSGGASGAASHRRCHTDRRKKQIRTYMQASITSNPSTERAKLHPRRSQSPTWGATAPHSQPDNPRASVSPFALFPFLGSSVWFASAAHRRACVPQQKKKSV